MGTPKTRSTHETVPWARRGAPLVALVAAVAALGCAPVVSGRFSPVITAHDWGPAVERLVVELDHPIQAPSLSPGSFEVTARRRDPGATAQGRRTVVAAHLSDRAGVATNASVGSVLTLELAVGPDEALGSPFRFDLSVFQSRWSQLEHQLTLKAPLVTAEGAEVRDLVLTAEVEGDPQLPDLAGWKTTDLFAYDDPTYGAIELGYAWWAPAPGRDRRPLVVWLHGAGEGGDDPRIALLGNRVTQFSSPQAQAVFGGAFVLVPQSPLVWMHNGQQAYPADGSTQYLGAVKALIDDFVRGHPEVDPDRVVIGGCSNGGFLTLALALTWPEAWAAAFPVCEAYRDGWISQDRLEALTRLPIWFVHAENDTTVNAVTGDYARTTYQRLRAAGARDARLSWLPRVVDAEGREYPGHFAWVPVLTNALTDPDDGRSLFAWLAAQRRGSSTP